MNKVRVYILEAYKELATKVTWPTWQELQKSAVVVLIASLIIAFILLIMDATSNEVLKFYYNL